MDVIGNNIANVNTTAYKSSSMVFNELLSQTTQRASGPNAASGTGGVNARQIGLGVKGGAININITGQGASQSTGNPFDIMITGDNFFIVNDGISNYFTRDGSFYVDGAGNLAMTSTGYNVMGWQVDEETGKIRQDTVSALRIMNSVNMTYPAEATTKAYMGGIMDKHDKDVTSANGKVVNLNFFDARGYSYTAKFIFKQGDNVDEYSVELDKILDSTGEAIPMTAEQKVALFGGPTQQTKSGKVSFDTSTYYWDGNVLKQRSDDAAVASLGNVFENGGLKADLTAAGTADGITTTGQEQLDLIAKAYGYEGSTDEFLNLLYQPKNTDGSDNGAPISILQALASDQMPDGSRPGKDDVKAGDAVQFDTVGRNFDGIKVAFDHDNGKFAGINNMVTANTIMLNLSELGGNFANIEIDFSTTNSSDNKGTSTLNATSGDVEGLVGMGRRLGKMIGVSVQQDGMIYASYDNGMTRLLGQIASAAFANASGLQKEGSNLYSATLNSGEFDGVGVDITANGGYMTSGQLEMSNVDLSAEFTEMITTQRGFQANSRIITVSDTLLEELTNLKR